MYTGAFRNESKLIKYLMPIRAELSIIAGILTLAHNISFGRNHFVNLFTAPETMSTNMKTAAGVSIILIAIMVPVALSDDTNCIINVAAYSVVFITYAVMRISKFLTKKLLYKSKQGSTMATAN
ncbi:hypothetical protein TEMA_13110 [Terrisporobacter mayombei]|uniref:Amino acid permease/ SLC12A domain-containing protein n=2 Tax=Terrisporobacter mayombei TaxID=1541 RepID=A0ABY9Q194_9FIRM|nr:hypothetical protein TEMA_13110 [Terrisporobacter mayombei]